MAGSMRLIGLDREDRRGETRLHSFGQAALGAAASVLLLALPLWALESVNDVAIDAVTHERQLDRPHWQGPPTPGQVGLGQAASGRQAIEPLDDPRDDERARAEESDD